MILFANRKYFVCPSVTEKLQQACKDSFINFYLMEKITKYIGFLLQLLYLHQIKNSFLFFNEVSFSAKTQRIL